MKALITLTLSLFLFLSCQEKQFKRDLVLDHNQVGDRYRVIWHLYAASDTIWTLGGIANSRSSKEGFDRFNEGDIFEITEIKRVSYSSWNEGDYSYLVLKLKLLTGERRGEVFSANNIIDSAEIGVDRFGRNRCRPRATSSRESKSER